MRIQFIAPDPRAGTTAQMDSSRGQQLIDSGAAVQVEDTEGKANVESKPETDTSAAAAPAARRSRKAK